MIFFTLLYKIYNSKMIANIVRGAFPFTKEVRKSLIQIFPLFLMGFIATATLQAQNTSKIINNGNIVITQGSGDHEIEGTGAFTSNYITINEGYEGTIILRNVKIRRSGSPSCIRVIGKNNLSNLTPTTKVNIILEGDNTLEFTGNTYCAFQVDQGAQIHINAIDRNKDSSGTLLANNTAAAGSGSGGGAAIGAPNSVTQGSGTITCDPGYSPGTRTNTAGGNIIIGSGIVKAYGGHAAGIGGGWWSYYDGIIIVYGGDVTSESKYHAAGIGSGCPEGGGVNYCYAPNSAIIALPPATIKACGTSGSGASSKPDLKQALAGANNIIYLNDINKSEITVHTEDYEKNADIYIDLSEIMANPQMNLVQLFDRLGVTYDLKKVRVGRTDPVTGIYKFNAEFKEQTIFFTDASSSDPAFFGRPYLPKTIASIKGNSTNKVDVELERLKMEISFTDYPSTPLIEGYTDVQARENAHTIKMEYNDNTEMSNLTFRLQGGGVDFETMIFLGPDRITPVGMPTKLKKGDIYYIVLPLKVNKKLGVYSDVLLIGGKWGTQDLPGYIRRIGQQRVVKDDTGDYNYIKVTADPIEFVDEKDPAVRTVNLTLNIDHKDTGILYDKLGVKAKYLITTEAEYSKALAANPDVNTWSNLEVPDANGQDKVTTISFSAQARGTYYIHWYVESGVVYAHSQDVTKPQEIYGGFGPYILTQDLTAGTITGNPSVCQGQTPSLIKGEASTGGSGNYSYQWQISTDNIQWTNITVNGNAQNYTPVPLTQSPTYYRRITNDNQYNSLTAISNVFVIRIVPDNQAFYWKKNTTDNNWNNPDNWVDASGVPLNMIPVSCANVYISSGANKYPSLHPDDTPTDICGAPVCQNITFAYGAELIYQHKLTYEKAYIQYNWGYYNNFSGVNHGDQPSNNGCASASPIKKRDMWYALAAPLKSMATGDFSFAGYPLTWQAGFNLAHPVTGEKGGEIGVGDFSKKFPTNDMPLSETNNAIAVKVALYQGTIGCTDHCNLEGLKGVIEIPYFEDNTKAALYPGHVYDRLAKESKFYYFNPQTLQLLHSPVGRMKRADEAYRFIYEESGLAPNIDVTGSTPSTVPGYKLKVKRQNSSSLKVMIGNPFMASINAKRFFDANSTKLKNAEGYQIFSSTEQTWKYYAFTSSGNIPPLQAFIVTLSGDEVDSLVFPLEGTYALTGTTFKGILPTMPSGRSLYVKSNNNNNLEGDYSILGAPETDEVTANVKKMVYSQGHITPETFFISPDNKDYNLIQAYEKGMREIGIGVKTSDTKSSLSLVFENVDEFCVASNLHPVLLDKDKGVMQDLLLNNVYYFNQRQLDPKDNYIDTERFVLQLLSPDDVLFDKERLDISITYIDKYIKVKSVQNIKEVQIYDMLGRKMYSETNISANYYTKLLSLGQGVYMVKVYTESGKAKVEKIMVL